jgi:hypothetical protein
MDGDGSRSCFGRCFVGTMVLYHRYVVEVP